ncbi:hypothetical protein Acsp05_43550 [Actinokineospora sp. NBRC 105648]|nr:hypothetical protein Acsp05_43550 [Actinokineospora sp. NBRC 105648]
MGKHSARCSHYWSVCCMPSTSANADCAATKTEGARAEAVGLCEALWTMHAERWRKTIRSKDLSPGWGSGRRSNGATRST